MFIESDADRAAFLADWGVMLGWTVGVAPSVDVTGVPFEGTVRIDMDDGPGVLNRLATVLCRTVALPAGAARDDAVTFQGKACRVKAIEPDGTGMSVIVLEEIVASQAGGA